MVGSRADVRSAAVAEYAADSRLRMYVEAALHERQPRRELYRRIGWAQRSLEWLRSMPVERSAWAGDSNVTHLTRGLSVRGLPSAHRCEVTTRDRRWLHNVSSRVLPQRDAPPAQVPTTMIANASGQVHRQKSRGLRSTRSLKLRVATRGLMVPKASSSSPGSESITHSVVAWAWMSVPCAPCGHAVAERILAEQVRGKG